MDPTEHKGVGARQRFHPCSRDRRLGVDHDDFPDDSDATVHCLSDTYRLHLTSDEILTETRGARYNDLSGHLFIQLKTGAGRWRMISTMKRQNQGA